MGEAKKKREAEVQASDGQWQAGHVALSPRERFALLQLFDHKDLKVKGMVNGGRFTRARRALGLVPILEALTRNARRIEGGQSVVTWNGEQARSDKQSGHLITRENVDYTIELVDQFELSPPVMAQMWPALERFLEAKAGTYKLPDGVNPWDEATENWDPPKTPAEAITCPSCKQVFDPSEAG